MKRRMNKRMATAALAGAMVLSMNGMAWAEPETGTTTEVKEFNFTKEVTTDGNTYAPNTVFEFTISNGAEGNITDSTNKTKVVYPGVTGGLSFKNDTNSITFTPGDTVAASYTGTGTITVDDTKFTKPGIYHYVLKETAGTYDGITYDSIEKHIYVYVANNGTDLIVEAVTVADGKDGEIGTEAKSDTLKFTNVYGDGTPDDKIHDFKVKKTVSGNQGEKERAFSFKITITPSTVGEKYKAVIDEGKYSESQIVIQDENLEDDSTNATATFSLKHDQTLHIYGLSENDEYTVIENDANTDGYTTAVPGNATGNLTTDNVVVEFINDKTVGPATGVAMTFAPYVLLVAAAGGLGAVVLGKKKREDDEI